MVATAASLLPSPSLSHHRTALSRLLRPSLRLHSNSSPRLRSRPSVVLCSASPPPSSSPLHALIFDCDGVILESEHLHRQAYNDAFAHFNVRCPPLSSEPLHWGVEFYDELQNRIGGGKPKMRWYFNENGWPFSTISESPPSENTDRENLIDVLQEMQMQQVIPAYGKQNIVKDIILTEFEEKEDWKTERYKDIIKSGTVQPRPGVLQLMDDAKGAGIKLAVCSAATKSSVILCLESLIGIERFHSLDCFLAGDDVKEKKPDPSIYLTAAKKLGVSGNNCLVVEDSVIGLQAATGAGMHCIITYTTSTANQDFSAAVATYPDLTCVRLEDLELLLQNSLVAN